MRLIDADALMKVIREHDYPLRSHFNSTDNGMFTIGIQQAVDEAPTIDAVPVVCGEWTRNSNYSDTVICSLCGWRESVWWADKGTNFCPNCGGKDGYNNITKNCDKCKYVKEEIEP